MTPPPGPQAAPDPAPGWLVPGALVLRLMLVAALAVALSGAVAAWLVTRASGQEAMRRVVSQQTDEVEVVARLLASKIEQSQKVLRTVAAGITPAVLESPSSLEWLLQQGLPAVQFFDTMQVARDNGELRLNLRAGQIEKAADLDPAERDALRRTLVNGKPLVSELIAGRRGEARVMFTMPLHRDDGTVMGVVAGTLRLQSQSLLPPSMTLPARDDSQLIVFTRDGTILSHSDPARVLGQVRDEAGLAPVYTRWQSQAQPVVGRGMTHVQADHIVSMAGMPLPQWIVARVSQSQALLAPLRGAQREAWWLAVASMVLCMLLAVALMGWMAQPLAQLQSRRFEPMIDPAAQDYFRELADHLQATRESITAMDDILTTYLQAALAQASFADNQDMRKISAAVAILAIPTTLGAIYGMNFDNMPELHTQHGYFVVLGLMLAGMVLAFLLFRRFRWL